MIMFTLISVCKLFTQQYLEINKFSNKLFHRIHKNGAKLSWDTLQDTTSATKIQGIHFGIDVKNTALSSKHKFFSNVIFIVLFYLRFKAILFGNVISCFGKYIYLFQVTLFSSDIDI